MSNAAHTRDGRSARRTFAAGTITALLLGALVLTAVGSGASAATSGGTSADARWKFTDDRGNVVNRPSRPVRIVAYETTAAALFHLGIKPVAIFGSSATPLSKSSLLAGVNTKGIVSLGATYGEINLERLAALKPDLIVTAFNPTFQPLWGFKDAAQQKKVAGFAPIVAINGIRAPTTVIGRFKDLARALGANLKAPRLVAAQARFTAAVKDLRAATAAKPGLTALALGVYGDGKVYFAKPPDAPALRQYRQWGLRMVVPGGSGSFWEIVSLEQIDKYPADLILWDNRPFALTPEKIGEATPTWKLLPAVKAGQLVPWQAQESWSYQVYSQQIRTLANAIKRANANVVP